MKLGTRLRTARKKLGMTLRDVERLTKREITNPQISMLERGATLSPRPITLRALSRVLKIPYIELMILAGHINFKDLKETR